MTRSGEDWDIPNPVGGRRPAPPAAQPHWWSDPAAPPGALVPPGQHPGRPLPPLQPSTRLAGPLPPPAAPPYGPEPRAPGDRLSGAAIASAVLGFFGIAVAGVPLGIVALRRIRQYQQTGKGLAVTGIALSTAWVVGLAIAAGLTYLAQAGHAMSPPPNSPRAIA